MRVFKLTSQLLLAMVLAVGLIGFGGLAQSRAANQETLDSTGANITLHVFECYQGVGGGDAIFNECHDWNNNALSGYDFTVAGVTRATDGGYVTWRPSAGTYDVVGYNIGLYSGAYVYCSNQVTGEVLYDGSADTDAVTVWTDPNQEVICDWYYIV
jgi:hypothetical protein